MFVTPDGDHPPLGSGDGSPAAGPTPPTPRTFKPTGSDPAEGLLAAYRAAVAGANTVIEAGDDPTRPLTAGDVKAAALLRQEDRLGCNTVSNVGDQAG